MKRLVAGLLVYIATATAAWASANVSCLIDDADLRFELEAIAGRAGPITQVHVGEIDLKAAKRTFKFDATHIVQQWSLGGDMRLQIEVGDDAGKETVDLVILAQLNRKTEKYSGRYVLKVTRAGKTTEAKGRLKQCEAG